MWVPPLMRYQLFFAERSGVLYARARNRAREQWGLWTCVFGLRATAGTIFVWDTTGNKR